MSGRESKTQHGFYRYSSGSFGTVLYYLLTDFKKSFLANLVSSEDTHRLQAHLSECLPVLLATASRYLKERREELTKGACYTWPKMQREIDKRLVVSTRINQLGAYVDSVSAEANKFKNLYQGSNEKTSRQLEKVLGAVIWPYFFLRIDAQRLQEEYKITWMPPMNLMRKDTSEHPGDLLYPSLWGTSGSKEILEQMAAWLRYGKLSIDLQELGKLEESDTLRDVGHVQVYNSERDNNLYYTNDLLFKEIGEQIVPKTASDSFFSDCMYFNRSALQVPIETEAGEVLGVLYLCSPLSLVGSDSEALENTGLFSLKDFEGDLTAEEFLGTNVREVWDRIGGNVIGTNLKSQCIDLVDNLVGRIDERIQVTRETMMHIRAHDLSNGIYDLLNVQESKAVVEACKEELLPPKVERLLTSKLVQDQMLKGLFTQPYLSRGHYKGNPIRWSEDPINEDDAHFWRLQLLCELLCILHARTRDLRDKISRGEIGQHTPTGFVAVQERLPVYLSYTFESDGLVQTPPEILDSDKASDCIAEAFHSFLGVQSRYAPWPIPPTAESRHYEGLRSVVLWPAREIIRNAIDATVKSIRVNPTLRDQPNRTIYFEAVLNPERRSIKGTIENHCLTNYMDPFGTIPGVLKKMRETGFINIWKEKASEENRAVTCFEVTCQNA